MNAKRAAREALDAWDPLEEAPHGEEWVLPSSSTEVVGELVRDAVSMARWHEGRDNGQKYRFQKLSACGSRVMIASCGVCSTERAPVLEGCGITRLCEQCSLRTAKKRRARFGRARQRVSSHLARLGHTRARRGPGGKRLSPRWTDKMLTLTVPHFLRCHLDEGAPLLEAGKVRAHDTTMARIYAVRAAWPIFARKLRRHWKQAEKACIDAGRPSVMVTWPEGKTSPPPFHRAFEWTPGGDGLGHPHFHIWLLCPFLDAQLITKLWTEALVEVGVPIGGRSARVQLQRFRDFDGNALGELVKSGNRKALEWSRLYKHGPSNAFEYADGWTISEALKEARPEVVASLYCALEGMRLTQASSGFFCEDEPPCCEMCRAQMCWHIRFEPAPESATTTTPTNERGPP